MKWNFDKLVILIVINVYTFTVNCQSDEDSDSFHNYDVAKSIIKSADDVDLLKNLKTISKEDENFLNAFEHFLPNAINPILLGSLPQMASYKCVQDLKYVFESLVPPSDWSLKMLDSFGKPESGILTGNVKWLGEYDECLKVYAPPKENTSAGDFHGKYCTIQIPLKVGNVKLPLSTAVCLPDSCNPNATFDGVLGKLPKILTGLIPTSLTDQTPFNLTGIEEQMESVLNNVTIACKAGSKDLTTGAIVVITFMSIIAFVAVIGSSLTVLEHYLKANIATKTLTSTNSGDNLPLDVDVESASCDGILPDGTKSEIMLPAWFVKCKPFFNCFCIFTNGEKLLNTASSEGQLPCLHGIRFLSLTWVILCHGYMGVANTSRNALGYIDHIDKWSFQVILNGFFSVDSFFVLSGFLVGYLYFKQAPKTDGKIPWLYYYIHRYIRLTPVYMIVLAFFTYVGPFLGSGPLWPEYTSVEACQDYWWYNLLYINNFKKQAAGCMGWTWYLANDMQFYVISPLLLITLYRWPKIGFSLFGLLFCITIAANFALTYAYDLVSGMGNFIEYKQDYETFMSRFLDFEYKIYIKPYGRIGAYLVGLLVAYVVYLRKQHNSPKLNTVTLCTGWLLASGVALFCQFGLYHQEPSLVSTSFYNALSRIGFSMGLGWVIFVCVIGQGGAVNSILSWNALIPLSRLTYCAYLVHAIVQTTYLTSVRTLIDFNHINVIMLFLGAVFISYSAALVTSLLFESPVIRLERLLRNKLSS